MSNTRNSRNSKSDPENVSSETVTVDTAKLDEFVAKAVTAATKTLHEEFSKLFDKLKERVNVAEKRIGEIESRVGEKSIRVDTDEKRLDDAMQKLDQESPAELKKEIQAIREEVQEFARLANNAEQHSRRKNLRFRGLSIKPGENCKDVVLSFCRQALSAPLSDRDIEIAHFLPLRETNAPGTSTDAKSTNPIIVRFFCEEVGNDIIMRRKVLKGTKQPIMEDLTALNGATLNRLHKNPRIDKYWSWNGRLLLQPKMATLFW